MNTSLILFLVPSSLSLSLLLGLFILWNLRRMGKWLSPKDSFNTLDLVLPDGIDQPYHVTQELFHILHSFMSPSTSFRSFFIRKKRYTFTIESTKHGGIRYLLTIPSSDREPITRILLSYLPTLTIKDDTLSLIKEERERQWWSIFSVAFTRHIAFPLKKDIPSKTFDPLTYVTSTMNKLEGNEKVIYNLVLSPVTHRTHPVLSYHLQSLYSRLVSGYDISSQLQSDRFLSVLFLVPSTVIKAVIDCLLLPLTLPLWLVTLGKTSPLPCTFPSPFTSVLVTSNAHTKERELLLEKLSSPLFEASLRFMVFSTSKRACQQRVKEAVSALSIYSSPYQSLKVKKSYSFLKHLSHFQLNHSLLPFSSPLFLTPCEVSLLFHPPYSQSLKVEGLVTSKHVTLPPTVDFRSNPLRSKTPFAHNNHGDLTTPLGLLPEERRQHVYILGATGTGKTTLLSTMISNDIASGKGLCIIDPHGDLVTDLLRRIPSNRLADVILFDPSDIEYPVGLNLLELTHPEDDLEQQKDLIASHLVSIFAKLSPPRYWGPRMETILRVATLTALETDQPTLFTIQRLLLDNQFRKQTIDSLTDPSLLLFWKREFVQLGSYQKAAMIAPITNKINRFLTSPHAKYILSQKTSTIDFDDLLKHNKILLCNVSKGNIGEDTSRLLGSLITTKIQLAALRRSHIPTDQRTDFSLYIDEFQNFATTSFAEILSEARKYGLQAILAHQTVAQVEDKDLIKVILANTGTLICFRTSNPSDREFILPFFQPTITHNDLSNLPSYTFYIKVNAVNPQDVMSGQTIPQQSIPTQIISDEVKRSSRRQVGVRRSKVASMIAAEHKKVDIALQKAVKKKKTTTKVS